MTYLEIHNEIMRIVWGDSPPPSSVSSLILSVGTTAENVASTAFSCRIGGVPYNKTAVAAGTAFSAANTINTGTASGFFWGVWLLQINSSGTISTKPGGGLADQVYTTEASAIAALPSADSNNYSMGYVTIQCSTGAQWLAITDDITAGSDCNDSNFYSLTGGAYKGADGIIGRSRKQLQEERNYFFMESTTAISIYENEIEYTLPSGFKEETSVLVYDSSSEAYRVADKLSDRQYSEYMESAQVINLQQDMVVTESTLSYGTTDENIASTAFRYRINGASYSKAAVAAGTAFSAGDTINTGTAAGYYWGVWRVQIDSDGTITTSSPSSDQVYTTEALAIAALPDVDTDNVSIGYVTVNSNSGADWTAVSDDLVDGSDCLEANFYSTATIVDHEGEWPMYYYIGPYSTALRKMTIFPVPEEDKTDCIYIKYHAYLDDLSDVSETWDAYSDYFSIEAPEVLIWMAVKDIAQGQRDQGLLQTAMNNMNMYLKLLKNKDWNYKIANGPKMPYEGV